MTPSDPTAGPTSGTGPRPERVPDPPRPVGEVVRWVDITTDELDADAVAASLDDLAAGAVCVFVGRVRDHDEGRDVSGLAYEAHPSALERMREVAERVAAEHDVRGLSVVHRVGEIPIGGAAVVAAASAAHRWESFRATEALVDTLKAEVPIWKHQTYEAGDAGWVGVDTTGG
ncbi:molybdenum cofactor biosynthesis protein MoaE [Nocardioides sp. CFH 31398]|uniref:molybdenum cofactor biosynthesis protein MoaE n=1 Tax=Nocardioides sp. CFH 31398 TaxID=2919579 RepID=UPI001F0603C5|nr:molybdenum cofactor biosynthesis protein MoaE [Nocardioides sp. CFH 31398]MCH1866515.1 molybdenum cofactor biosynthesis protein MoaE [Nocardioides sp. CFH 31398]